MRVSSRHISALFVLLALVTAVSACGGGDAGVPADAIAVVGDQDVSRADFQRVLEQAQKNYEAQKQEFPKAGTPEYENLKSTIVKSLVDQAKWEQKGAEMGIEVTDADIDKELATLVDQEFKGDQKAYEDARTKLGLSEEQVRRELEGRVLSRKIYDTVTKAVKVTDGEVTAYYEQNKEQFRQAESRDVRHILVKSKALADRLYTQIRSGGDFARLAERYSEDPSSAKQGGKYTAVKGASVAPFDKFVFAGKTGELSKPIKTQFGWHVIEILSAVKPASVTPVEEVKESIRQTLLQQKQSQAMRKWIADLDKEFAGEIEYAAGFAPAQTGTGTTTSGG
jgi:foldase protein PrsA